jgi:glycosyltransferase involved in cell wall biosynthesis
LQNGNYDIIIGVHAPLAGRLATMKRDLPNVKCIGWIHNSFEALFGDNYRYIGAVRKRHYFYQFRKLDHTIVLCKHDAETYHQYDPAFKPTVIYNPLTLVPGAPSIGTTKSFLAVGRFSHQHKGFDLLIEAFHLFSQRNKEWKLDIVGEGVEENLYRSLIKKYKLEERVTIHPFTNQIQAYYSKAQVYVLSSRWEGMPLVLVEAMSHGLPIVTSDIPVSQEILGDFGLYFKKGDVTDLAERLEEATHINWPQKSQEALEIAKRFDISYIIQHWNELIEND